MPNIKSAKKRMKQDVIRREKNRHDKRTLRTQCRKVREAVAAGDVPTAQSELAQAAKLLAPRRGSQGDSSQRGRPHQGPGFGRHQGHQAAQVARLTAGAGWAGIP